MSGAGNRISALTPPMRHATPSVVSQLVACTALNQATFVIALGVRKNTPR